MWLELVEPDALTLSAVLLFQKASARVALSCITALSKRLLRDRRVASYVRLHSKERFSATRCSVSRIVIIVRAVTQH